MKVYCPVVIFHIFDCTCTVIFVYISSFQNHTVIFIKASHYVNVSVLIKFSQKTGVFTIIIISSP